MSKQIKKKLKKKDKEKALASRQAAAEVTALKKRIKQLEKELDKRARLIEDLNRRLKKGKKGKAVKAKPDKKTANPLFRKQTKGVGVDQRRAWQRHGYLRDRYEFHLTGTRDKTLARSLADQDLRERYGEDAGYTEQELEQILS